MYLFKVKNGNCNFDENDCGYTQDTKDDDFDWTLRTGRTQSYGTGPPYDHTKRTTAGKRHLHKCNKALAVNFCNSYERRRFLGTFFWKEPRETMNRTWSLISIISVQCQMFSAQLNKGIEESFSTP